MPSTLGNGQLTHPSQLLREGCPKTPSQEQDTYGLRAVWDWSSLLSSHDSPGLPQQLSELETDLYSSSSQFLKVNGFHQGEAESCGWNPGPLDSEWGGGEQSSDFLLRKEPRKVSSG